MIHSYFDVLIIGSGLSGINSAYRIQEALPDARFAVLEARHELGGTWSQFKYPGVRSDSDLHTLGFQFYPWRAKNPIATGPSIMNYLQETAQKFDIDKKIRYRHKVLSADWKSDQQHWKLEVEVDNEVGREPRIVTYWTKWLIMGTGYYNYTEPLQANIPGIDKFQGKIVHPQFWPQDLDYKDKKMIVVGSGATSITLLPALVDGGVGSVTQLQRSPSYIMSIPQDEEVWCEKWAPEWFTLRYKRFLFLVIPVLLYKFCIWFPSLAASVLVKKAASQLPPEFPVDPHFKPGYNPWQQRMCLCPDGDYFKAFNSGRAHIVTDTIKNVHADGIELTSGHKLNADIIVTATGLNMQLLGGIDVSVDGEKVDISSQYMWRNSMLTNLPNLGNILGYWNASWTLGSDLASRMFVRLIKHQRDHGYTNVVPVIDEKAKEKTTSASPLNSTYIKNAMSKMPHCADSGPWKPRDNWFLDSWGLKTGSLEEGLKWEKVVVE
ncbi:FAD dependent oxidoreductase [Pyrenophora tritici-repentis]|uniref:FAD dependent oxidoreductase n=2 Tax=Pyrenophora tritici-repentis TaxID=45151 RepID=A0A2W1FHU1_9PLEO|nr:FAD dependent oxidoreductase [Pyrenophora tritici-repentis Pt-1C-BFP]KAA8620003.1 FAD dependent oxidoreductase [Pyrenophora tritici-repentis]EDU46774.1 FAD dependent oxidoreductase [Pyrenophora tritici-repentis Pt-1C-BFP]KAF7448159.1 FAD dependent oxidoreductase [Pyrenophora tritici-repentis]KAF7571870.1 FAD dependent oxidoreductase [Pyrenophora tritici-repentis]KAG9384938.1 FAD dependent oxidoreductase [Pyrenophora tritici-repentis]